MPAVATYLVLPAWSAAAHPSLMCCGVSKSGSPAAKLQTSSPAAARAFALASTASVGDGEMLRAHDERGGGGCEGILVQRRPLKGPQGPERKRGAPLTASPAQAVVPSAGLRFRRREGLEREPQKLAHARVLLLSVALEHGALVRPEADGNLAVRVAGRLAALEVKLFDGKPHDLTGGLEPVSAPSGLDPRDEGCRQIER